MDRNPAAADDSKPSSAETDQNNDMGTGRSYECVFCKRGFTTAQALGGHMNIHRKDRVKTKTTSSIATNSTKPENFNHGTLRPNHLMTQSYPSLSMANSELHINYPTYFPSSTWSLGSTTSVDHHVQDELYVHNNNPQLLNAFKENWHRNLSSPVDHQVQEKRVAGGNGEEEELDLELRLGHDR